MCEIQWTEVFLSGFNALYTFSHLLNEIESKTQWDDGRQTNENITLKIKSKW
jgi:hypothetical protein